MLLRKLTIRRAIGQAHPWGKDGVLALVQIETASGRDRATCAAPGTCVAVAALAAVTRR
ncbi:hypothetical protein [Paraburkholderia heleia]|uniref:hypothetical protein n=1 Tax=Paraburkholderia heleia TaxID=634127 RepID=UPI000A7A5F92|nr:hypothetical protein [Paraburkholderia heleia]